MCNGSHRIIVKSGVVSPCCVRDVGEIMHDGHVRTLVAVGIKEEDLAGLNEADLSDLAGYALNELPTVNV